MALERRTTAALAVVAVGAIVATGCGANGSVSEAEFARRLADRESISMAEAECVAGYVFDENPPSVVEQLHRGDFREVDMTRWNSLGHAVAACTFADDLGIELDDEHTER